jgi:hypothetical protein
MAAPKLNEEQRTTLLTWLAADYSESLIKQWFKERKWPELSSSAISYYRKHKRYGAQIATARADRRASALQRGLALKEERVQRLVEHADELEAIKWKADDKGRLWNEKAWRETLDDIAREMGHRRPDIEGKLVEFLDQLRDILSPADYARALARFAAGAAGSESPGS